MRREFGGGGEVEGEGGWWGEREERWDGVDTFWATPRPVFDDCLILSLCDPRTDPVDPVVTDSTVKTVGLSGLH